MKRLDQGHLRPKQGVPGLCQSVIFKQTVFLLKIYIASKKAYRELGRGQSLFNSRKEHPQLYSKIGYYFPGVE
jgi:hypothetical protein